MEAKKMTAKITKNYDLQGLYQQFIDTDTTLIGVEHGLEITLDNHDVNIVELCEHDGSFYFAFSNPSTSLNKSFWVTDDDHVVTISTISTISGIKTDNQETADDNNQETADDNNQETAVEEVFNKVDRILEQCQELSLDEILSVIGKLSGIANKKNKAENKPKKQKVEKPEKAEKRTDKKGRPSSKTFDYLDLLRNWHNSGLTPGEIENTELASGYGRHTIQEDLRVYNVLYNLDSKLVISEEWRDYIIGYWEQNPSTVWNRLHYAFAKDGRKCHDIGLLCNYVINNGVTKDDIINAIAAQN